ncbi:MAG TPA: phosphotransferase family protein [Caulobacteraceae bacterium]|nr:phosphotransferase family protein [Caulobacteraceae bacterium]
MADLTEARIAGYIEGRLAGATDVTVSDLRRIVGGASRETYRLKLAYTAPEGQRVERPLILRRDPPDSLIDTKRDIEFAAYAAFYGSAVPVPEMLWLEEDPAHLDFPFFIAEELVGFESSPTGLLSPPYSDKAEAIGLRKWTILGEISKADPVALGLDKVMELPTPQTCWTRELGYWEREVDKDEVEPQPIIRAAIRWLRANPPPPAQKISVVHGDYRSGNFLYDSDGEIHGILDWEMAHLGDPLEDLGWGLNRIWCWGGDDRRGGLLPRERAIEIWENASGLRADPAALHWWELFNCVKGQGIWVSSAKAWIDGQNRDPILAFSAWRMLNAQDRAALELMGKL